MVQKNLEYNWGHSFNFHNLLSYHDKQYENADCTQDEI